MTAGRGSSPRVVVSLRPLWIMIYALGFGLTQGLQCSGWSGARVAIGTYAVLGGPSLSRHGDRRRLRSRLDLPGRRGDPVPRAPDLDARRLELGRPPLGRRSFDVDKVGRVLLHSGRSNMGEGDARDKVEVGSAMAVAGVSDHDDPRRVLARPRTQPRQALQPKPPPQAPKPPPHQPKPRPLPPIPPRRREARNTRWR